VTIKVGDMGSESSPEDRIGGRVEKAVDQGVKKKVEWRHETPWRGWA
jgi:hypothetical protein